MSDFDREAMMEMFIYEMSQLIEQLENNTIQIDGCYSIDIINEIFRIMHTIKGSAAMMLFTNISVTAHAIEDLFFYLRENNPKNVDYTKVTDFVLEVVDFIKDELEKIEAGEELGEASDDLKNRIIFFIQELKNMEQSDDNINENDNLLNEEKIEKKEEEKNIEKENNKLKKYKAEIFFEKGSEMENVRAFTVLRNLEKICIDITYIPKDILDENSIEIIRKDGFKLEFFSQYDYDDIKKSILESVYISECKLEVIDNLNSIDLLSKDKNKEVLKDNLHEYSVTLFFEEGSEMENVRAYTLVHNLKDIAEKLTCYPENLLEESSIAKIREQGIKLNIITSKSYNEIESYLSKTIYLKYLNIIEKTDKVVVNIDNVKDVKNDKENKKIEIEDKIENKKDNIKDISVKDKGTIQINKDNNLKNTNTAVKSKKNIVHAISVNVQKLDQLLNLVGELVISEAMVTQNPDLEGLDLDSFTKEARQLHKIINDVQDTVMSMRMVPLSATFFKMHRIVRDMCKQLKKEVQLEVIGEETEVDKNIIEHISDPLMHIIRNSVDHGIEMPDVRKKRGKPEKGTVTLEAKNSGGDVLIIIRDDGAGFDRDKIIEKAKKQDILTKEENEYTDKEVFQFIFLPGFSTNDKVTSFSGRGVGMDVVSTNIEFVGGTVLADSVKDEGSIITLKIPLTLAIIEGMLINIGDAKYTIPIISIKRSFKASENDLVIDPNGNEMILVRGECYNLLRLNKYFGMEGTDNIEEGIVLMLEDGEQTICVFADELIGEQQVVVKNIPKYIKKVPGISGCTLLGNGDISLIIDIASFFDR